MESLALAKTAASILDAKKADHLNVVRITDISSLGDYFVIASGTSSSASACTWVLLVPLAMTK